jgi:hypothetical protein
MAIVSALDDRLRCVVAAAMLGFPAATFFGVLRAFDTQPHSLALRVAGVTALSAFGLVALLYSLGWKLAR